MGVRVTPGMRFIAALFVATIASVVLLAAESIANHTLVQAYLLLNIVLAWIPLGLALWLRRLLRHKLWSSWEGLFVSLAWLAFLPNSFYLITDFIHLHDVAVTHLLVRTITITAFVFASVLLGISSVYVAHLELRKRLATRLSITAVSFILLVCSFAIYIGRDLRWNSWDLVINPMGVLFDVSERLEHPLQYGQIISVVAPLFILLCSTYAVAWYGIRLIMAPENKSDSQ